MQVGDVFGPFIIRISREQLVRYAGAADDYNPIHYNDAVAKAFGFPGVIVHGMLNMGLMASRIMEQVEPSARLEQFHVRFRQMVLPDHELMITARVRQIEERIAHLDVQLGEKDTKPAVTGRMRIRLPG
ncbi:MAG: dehydratase [Sulfobacillus acidophilus]|uniref:Dehydratase n=1 Tax=Sulfobacillus acidophilus TaxID=53633 RepID=A0A2T2WKV5_9FIRM|nr:MAG: dehydratase [Sulfobacillus acidophilus]